VTRGSAGPHHTRRSAVSGAAPGALLGQFPLVDTSDIGEAEARGARLLSEYRLDVRREPSFNARVNGCSLGSVDLYYLDFGATEVDVASAALPGRFGIVLPVAGSMRMRYRSREFDVAGGFSAALVSPGADFRMTWSEGFSSLVVRIESSNFAALARSLDPDADIGEITFDPLISRPASVQSLRSAVQVFYECVARAGPGERVPPLLAGRAREQLVTTLLMMQPNDLVGRLYRSSERISHRGVREAVDLVESDTASVGGVAELARRVGLTTRSLQMGFQKELGLGPAAYIQNVRLARAREELTAARPGEGVTVADVARRWGFPHAGRFAVYYRQRFGESPSDTLRHSRD